MVILIKPMHCFIKCFHWYIRCYCEFLGSKLNIYLVPFKCQCYVHSVIKAIHVSLGLSNALLSNPTEKKFLFVLLIIIKINVSVHWQSNNMIFHLTQSFAITKLQFCNSLVTHSSQLCFVFSSTRHLEMTD